MSGMVLRVRDKQEKKDELGTCPHGNDSIKTKLFDHYLHFIVGESGVLERQGLS